MNMDESNQLLIHQNRLGTFTYMIGTIIMSIASVIFLIIDFRKFQADNVLTKFFAQNTVGIAVLRAGLLILMISCTFAAIHLFKRLMLKKKVLVVDDKGILENSTVLTLGFIPWSDIEDIYVNSRMGSEIIEIKIKDEDKYINDLTWIKRKAIEIKKKMGHQLVCINLNNTEFEAKEIFLNIEEIFNKYKE